MFMRPVMSSVMSWKLSCPQIPSTGTGLSEPPRSHLGMTDIMTLIPAALTPSQPAESYWNRASWRCVPVESLRTVASYRRVSLLWGYGSSDAGSVPQLRDLRKYWEWRGAIYMTVGMTLPCDTDCVVY